MLVRLICFGRCSIVEDRCSTIDDSMLFSTSDSSPVSCPLPTARPTMIFKNQREVPCCTKYCTVVFQLGTSINFKFQIQFFLCFTQIRFSIHCFGSNRKPLNLALSSLSLERVFVRCFSLIISCTQHTASNFGDLTVGTVGISFMQRGLNLMRDETQSLPIKSDQCVN